MQFLLIGLGIVLGLLVLVCLIAGVIWLVMRAREGYADGGDYFAIWIVVAAVVYGIAVATGVVALVVALFSWIGA